MVERAVSERAPSIRFDSRLKRLQIRISLQESHACSLRKNGVCHVLHQIAQNEVDILLEDNQVFQILKSFLCPLRRLPKTQLIDKKSQVILYLILDFVHTSV